ncbi:MAG: hypothetical protein ACYDAN_18020, partial [Candidatus Limnocylindrales bacterium]
ILISLPVYLTSPSFADVGGQQTAVAGSPLDRLGDEGLSALAPMTTGYSTGWSAYGVLPSFSRSAK